MLFSTTAALRARSVAARWAAAELARVLAAVTTDALGRCAFTRAALLVVVTVEKDRPVGEKIGINFEVS